MPTRLGCYDYKGNTCLDCYSFKTYVITEANRTKMVGGDCIRVHKQLKKKAGVRVFRCSRTDRLITNYVPLGIVGDNKEMFIATKPDKLKVCDHFDG